MSTYLKDKEKNIQLIFEPLHAHAHATELFGKDPDDALNLEKLKKQHEKALKQFYDRIEALNGEIYTYKLLLFNSLTMIVSLLDEEMITFHEIHRAFDSLAVFHSQYEVDTTQKLLDISTDVRGLTDKFDGLMGEMSKMNNQICNSLEQLTYVTDKSNRQISDRLEKVNKTMRVGNMIAAVNAYQNSRSKKLLG